MDQNIFFKIMYVYSQNDSDQEHNVYDVNNDFDLIILNHTQFF